jgi:D-glycero-D-manno-heptose 1,7-bisphosphate phosphatase
MGKHRLIVFDADGTLRRSTVWGQPCPNRPGEWELLPRVKEVLAEIPWGRPEVGGVGFGIASNQGGVGLGYLSEEMARQLIVDMVVEIFGEEPAEGTIQICPHRPDAGCECRKPGPLMLERLIERWKVPAEETLYVGDMESDRQAAENTGCHFEWAGEFFGRRFS